MREFIIDNGFLLVAAIAVFHLLILLGTIFLKGRLNRNKAERIILSILCIGLFYDAAVIAAGSFIGAGSLLWIMSIVRFLLSAVLVPLLIPISAYATDVSKKWMRAVWLGFILFVTLGLVHTVMTSLEVRELAGLVRYAASDATPRWAKGLSVALNLLCVLPLIISGIRLIPKKHNIAMLLAGVLMLAFSVIGPATGNADLTVFFSMFGEACMTFFLFLHVQTVTESPY